jgi:hypothetical protein
MSLEIPNRLTNMLKKVAQDAMRKAIRECSIEYNFSEEEALMKLNIEGLRIREKGKVKGNKKEKNKMPLPYNNEYDEECCNAVRLNQGLYTQCENKKEEGKLYCKGCSKRMSGEMPEYGTIQMRQSKKIMEYVDPNGRKPVAYVKIMKRLNITREEVMEEARKRNIKIEECHFEEVEQKRGRPAAAIKEKVEKGAKGRPKKTKKVVEVMGENEVVDIFASLVASSKEEENATECEKKTDELFANLVSEVSEKKTIEEDEAIEKKIEETVNEKEEKRKEKEQREKEREEKRKEKEQREKEKEEKRKEKELKEKEKEEKRKEKEQREKEKEEKRKEKELKEKEKEEKRKQKELKEAGKKNTKEVVEVKKASEVVSEVLSGVKNAEVVSEVVSGVKKAEVVSEVVVEVKKSEEEEEKFKKIIYNGTKYLVSRKTSIAYDYDKYANGEPVVVGKYNEKTKVLEKDDDEEEVSSDEESEDEYDE